LRLLRIDNDDVYVITAVQNETITNLFVANLKHCEAKILQKNWLNGAIRC